MSEKTYNKLIIHTDGGARGNPGPAGIGIVIETEDNELIEEYKEYIGETTNNQAEYQAVVKAFELLKKYNTDVLEFFLDSELIVKQITGKYKVKNKDLAVHFVKIHNAEQLYKNVSFTHVRRAENKHADSLVNKALDEQL